MPARHLPARLTAVASVLLAGQLLLLGWLYALPMPADTLSVEIPPRGVGLVGDPPATDGDQQAVRVLDALLAQRVEAAATRQGLAPGLPDPALRAAALAQPDPQGPAVAALIEAYGARLGALGETLDATSSRATEAGPERPGPAAAPPHGSPPPAKPESPAATDGAGAPPPAGR